MEVKIGKEITDWNILEMSGKLNAIFFFFYKIYIKHLANQRVSDTQN